MGQKNSKIERLERRTFLSVSLNSTSGLLSVNAIAAGDAVVFGVTGAQLTVTDAGTKYAFAAASVKAIQVALGGGADLVSLPMTITVPATLAAGSGPDTMIGGGGPTTLVSGAGNDSLVGNGPATDYSFTAQSSPVTYTLNQAKGGTNRLDFTALPTNDGVVANTSIDLLAVYTNVHVVDAVAGQFIHFNQIYGGQGDDILSANNAGDTLIAGNGSDYIYGNTGPDYIQAGSGYDVINGNGGADSIFGGAGKDVIYVIDSGADPIFSTSPVVEPTTPASPGAVVHAGSGDTSIVGGPGPDSLYAGAGNDTIHGMAGDDLLVGGSGNVVLFGGSGNNTIYGGTGNATIASGSGIDTVYGGTAVGKTTFIDKNLPDEKSTAQDGSTFDIAGLATNAIAAAKGTATPTYVPLGSSGPGDIVIGSAANTTIVGGLGNDTLRSGDGGSVVVAGSGDDLLIAGGGSDCLYGGAGADTLCAGGGGDLMVGGTGDSIFLNLNGYPDTIIGGSGQNVFQKDPTGKTTVTGVQVTYTPLNPTASSTGLGTGGTYVAPFTGNLDLVFNDTFGAYGDNTGSFHIVFAGIDYTLQGNNLVGIIVPVVAGRSYVYTATGLINNGTGATFGPAGNASHDSVSKFTPVPSAHYGSLAGILKPVPLPAPAAVDAPVAIPLAAPPAALTAGTVSGGVLHVGSSSYSGTQTITINEDGNGIISVNQAGLPLQQMSSKGINLVSVLGGSGSDTINLNTLLVPATVNAGNGNNTIIGGTANETLTAGTGNDSIIGGVGNNSISGGSGNNVLYGGTGSDVINGGSGSDWIYPGGFGVSLYNDIESDTINGGTGTEKVDLAGNADAMTIRLDKGTITDNVTGTVTRIKSVRNLWAGAGNDLIVGASAGGTLLNAGSGNDTIFGTGASDIIYGGTGSDLTFLDGKQGYLDLIGNHATTPKNTDHYNQGNTIIPASIDSTDILVALQKAPG